MMSAAVTSSMAVSELTEQKKHDYQRQENVEQRERQKRNNQAGHRCDGGSRPHHTLNDPWLSSDFRHSPSCFNRDQAQRRCADQRAQKAVAAEKLTPPPFPETPKGDNHHHEPGPNHNLKGDVHHGHRWPVFRRKIVQSFYDRLWI